ncbi:MAG: hypothetical protein ACK583_03845 [Cyanobacteriota bacterium]
MSLITVAVEFGGHHHTMVTVPWVTITAGIGRLFNGLTARSCTHQFFSNGAKADGPQAQPCSLGRWSRHKVFTCAVSLPEPGHQF